MTSLILRAIRGLAKMIGVFLLTVAPAAAQYCPPANISAFSASSMAVGTYSPFVATVPKIVTITITTRAACAISLYFFRDPQAPVMTQGASNLTYQIEQAGGGNSYVYLSGYLAPAANRIDIVTTGAQTVTRQVQVRVDAGQIVTAGNYSDTNVTMILASQQLGLWYLVAQTTVTPTATVAAVCRLDAPSPSSLSFASSEIPNAVPNPAIVKNATMTAACTAPTVLRLTGSALTLTPSAPGAAGFDDFINYRAAGTFGSASTTLNTTTTSSSATSSGKNVASGATTSGSVSVNVNLVAGNTAMAGTYSGVLTVTIDPNL